MPSSAPNSVYNQTIIDCQGGLQRRNMPTCKRMALRTLSGSNRRMPGDAPCALAMSAIAPLLRPNIPPISAIVSLRARHNFTIFSLRRVRSMGTPGLMLGKALLNDLPFNPDRQCHEMLAAVASPVVCNFSLYVSKMTATLKTTDYLCPVCQGRGRVPGRQRLCEECHGTGRITPIRREQLLKRVKKRVRG